MVLQDIVMCRLLLPSATRPRYLPSQSSTEVVPGSELYREEDAAGGGALRWFPGASSTGKSALQAADPSEVTHCVHQSIRILLLAPDTPDDLPTQMPNSRSTLPSSYTSPFMGLPVSPSIETASCM
jgi:hypothetical protein